MNPLRSSLGALTLLFMAGLNGCASIEKVPSPPPATLDEIKVELSLTANQLQNAADLRHNQYNRQQAALAEQLNDDFKYIHEALSMLDTKIKALQDTDPAPVVISDDKCPPPPQGQTADGKLLLGETEWLWLDAAGQAFQARIDTGATTSSLSAADITIFERDGKDWARFFMSHQGMDDRIQIEAPLVRHVRIKQASAEDIDRRPVVRLSVRIGDLNEKTQFTLADRNHMSFPVLLGRDFLKDIAVVDVGRTFVQPTPRKDKP
ncbi:MAG: ATP-dependent zinc protease [Deltaproteobacteria bacterium]|nr:ATP-dependent zinc protease [Deltaproteobacteria bacterium]